jgi:hypothetical protein
LVAHSTQIPLLHTPLVQSALVMHVLVQTCAAVSHLGAAGSVQSVLVAHSTHKPVPVSHTSMAAWQSALVAQPLHTPILQKGVGPPHCPSLVHAPPPLLLVLALLLVVVIPLLVVVIPLLVVVIPLFVVVVLVDVAPPAALPVDIDARPP